MCIWKTQREVKFLNFSHISWERRNVSKKNKYFSIFLWPSRDETISDILDVILLLLLEFRTRMTHDEGSFSLIHEWTFSLKYILSPCSCRTIQKKTTTLSIRRMNEISKPVKWRENRKNSISRIENDSKRITLKEMKISYMRGTMTTCVLPFLYVVCELWIVECWVKNRVFSRDENGIFLSHFVTWKVEGWYTFVLIYYAFVTFGFYSIFINASLFYTWCQNFQIRPAIALFNSYSHPRNTTSHMTNLQNFWQLSSFQVHTSVWGKSQKDVH